MKNIKEIEEYECIMHYNKSINIMIPLQQDTVKINHRQWTEQVRKQVKRIPQWEVRVLLLNDNHRVAIIKEIAHVRFPALTYLSLCSNHIESVERLCRVPMPRIQKLVLNLNSITSVGTIRKAAWPALQRLDIMQNYFGDAKSLTQGCLPEMKELCVYFGWEYSQFSDQCFPAKMQTTVLHFLSIAHEKVSKKNFVFDRRIAGVFRQRWQEVVFE